MDGVGPVLEDLFNQHLDNHIPYSDTYTMVEIGSAGCVSLRSFRDIIAARQKGLWRVVGFDLSPDKAWSLDMGEVKKSFDGVVGSVATNPLEASLGWSDDNSMTLVLLDDPRVFLAQRFPFNIDFAFIDGCHGICSGKDFLAIENKVAVGGLVVFHDYGEAEQGSDFQIHCREFISVRSYVHRLGLAAPCVVSRKGWRFIGEIKGSRHWGGDGNSCAVIQRTNEALEYQPELSIN